MNYHNFLRRPRVSKLGIGGIFKWSWILNLLEYKQSIIFFLYKILLYGKFFWRLLQFLHAIEQLTESFMCRHIAALLIFPVSIKITDKYRRT